MQIGVTNRDSKAPRSRFSAGLISMGLSLLLAVGCEPEKPSEVLRAGSVLPSAVATTSAEPITISGVALDQAVAVHNGGELTCAVWIHTLNLADQPKDLVMWHSGQEFVATAVPSEASNWQKIGLGDRVTFSCGLRTHVRALWGCKLIAFSDTNFDLSAMPRNTPR